MSCIPVWHCPGLRLSVPLGAHSMLATSGDFSWYPSSSKTTVEVGAQDLPGQSTAVTLGSWKKALVLKGKHETFNAKWEGSDCVWPLDGILVQRRDRLGLGNLFPWPLSPRLLPDRRTPSSNAFFLRDNIDIVHWKRTGFLRDSFGCFTSHVWVPIACFGGFVPELPAMHLLFCQHWWHIPQPTGWRVSPSAWQLMHRASQSPTLLSQEQSSAELGKKNEKGDEENQRYLFLSFSCLEYRRILRPVML